MPKRDWQEGGGGEILFSYFNPRERSSGISSWRTGHTYPRVWPMTNTFKGNRLWWSRLSSNTGQRWPYREPALTPLIRWWAVHSVCREPTKSPLPHWKKRVIFWQPSKNESSHIRSHTRKSCQVRPFLSLSSPPAPFSFPDLREPWGTWSRGWKVGPSRGEREAESREVIDKKLTAHPHPHGSLPAWNRPELREGGQLHFFF